MTTASSKAISPSQVAVMAAGLAPSGLIPAPSADRCVMCGIHHAAGESVVPFVPTDTFMDYPALRNPTGTHMCRWCDAAWSTAFAQTYLKTVMCAEGVFPAAKNENLAYWLLNPPAGNWLFLQGDQKVQHVVFRAPVNRSTEIFQIQMGEAVVTVRRAMLEKGLAAAKELAQAANDLNAKKGKRGPPLKSPFIDLSRSFTSPSHGAIRQDLLIAAAHDAQVALNLATLSELTPGELWGLTSVLYVQTPVRPAPIAPSIASSHLSQSH